MYVKHSRMAAKQIRKNQLTTIKIAYVVHHNIISNFLKQISISIFEKSVHCYTTYITDRLITNVNTR